jgi:transcriptional regulator with XRE-family HTH domain
MFPMDKETSLALLGRKIALIRNEKGLTQAQLANAIGKDQQSLQRLEAGRINPSYIYLTEIAQGLDVPVDVLFK